MKNVVANLGDYANYSVTPFRKLKLRFSKKHLTFYNINLVKTKIALLKPTFIYFNMTI